MANWMLLLTNPWNWLVLLALVIVSAGSGIYVGNHWAAGDCAIEEVRVVRQQAATTNAVMSMGQTVATDYERGREARRQFEHRNAEEARANVEQNPAYHQCGLDAAGLRLWNDRNAGGDTAPGQPDPALPHLAAHLGWHAPGFDPQSSGDYLPLSRMPEAAERAGRVGDETGAAD